MIHLSIFTVFAVVLVARFALAETLASLLHVPIRVSYCGREAEHTLGINQVYLTPEHPSFGSPLEVSFSGTPTKELACDGSVLELEVQIFGVTVFEKSFPICDAPSKGQKVPAGRHFSRTVRKKIPGDSALASLLSNVPVDIKAKVVTASGDVAECIEFSLTLGAATGKEEKAVNE